MQCIVFDNIAMSIKSDKTRMCNYESSLLWWFYNRLTVLFVLYNCLNSVDGNEGVEINNKLNIHRRDLSHIPSTVDAFTSVEDRLSFNQTSTEVGQVAPDFTINTKLNLSNIQQNNKEIKSWFLENNITYHDNMDWDIILNVFQNLTLDDILKDVDNWNIFIEEDLPPLTKFKEGLKTMEDTYTQRWIIQNPDRFNEYLVGLGFPDIEYLQTIEWQAFINLRYSFLTRNWIVEHPAEFIGMILVPDYYIEPQPKEKVINKKVLYLEQLGDIPKIWFEQHGMRFDDNFNWELFVLAFPDATVEGILNCQTENPDLNKKLFGTILPSVWNINPNWTSIIQEQSIHNMFWIVKNTEIWNQHLINNGFPSEIVQDVNWLSLLINYPQITPDLIENDTLEFIAILLRRYKAVEEQKHVEATKYPLIKWNMVFKVNPFITVDWILNNIDTWELILEDNEINLQVDWVHFFEAYPYYTIELIMDNMLSFMNQINVFMGKQLYIDWNLINEANRQDGEIDWVLSEPIEWTRLLVKGGFPLTYVITVNWQQLFDENNHVNEEWMRSHQEEWIDLLKKYQNTVVDDNYKWELLFTLHPYMTWKWIMKNMDQFVEILKLYDIDDGGIDWIDFFTKHKNFDPQWVLMDITWFTNELSKEISQ